MRRGSFILLIAPFVVVGCNAQIDSEPVVMRGAVTSSTAPLMDDLLGAYGRAAPHVSFEITHGNADTVRMALAGGLVDWGLVAYLPADSDLWSAPVGTDALAVVVHPDNALAGLTLGQVGAIFQGRAYRWSEYGGAEAPIVVVSRESGSGARGAFDEFVMSGAPTTPAARLATNGEGVLTIVGGESGAIGYVSLGLVDARVRPLAIDGVSPSQEAAQSGRYRVSSVIRFVAREEPDGASGDFLSWVLSEEGQAVVAQRYAPLVR